jgi:phosphoserine aminotransferase
MSFKKMADADSMLNTPNCFGIYVAGLTFQWIKAQGGVAALEKVNIDKANLLYGFLDESKLFKGTAQPQYRSRMNVTFVTGDPDKDAAFVNAAAAKGLVNLKGHRIVGCMRASIYNAMPVEGVKSLVDFMKEFEAQNK